ncbi:MAG TPA: FtsK/SpoIIIE domain-containing protein [Ktedonobacteraceae bacterium]|nr:FtsK/SpoIIIE domain-containing protein [Ktedonobacteraceae bacterium]
MNSAYGNTRLARQLVKFATFIDVALLGIVCSTLNNDGAGAGWSILLALAVNGGVGFYAVRSGLVFELRLERRWKAVCVGLGGRFASHQVKLIANPLWWFGGSLTREHAQVIVPKFRDARGDFDGFTATIIPFAGHTVDMYTENADAFALGFYGAPYVTFELVRGTIQMRVGQVPVPEKYEYMLHALPPAPASPAAVLQAVPMARDINDAPWYMPIEGNHILLVGRTGSGKSSWIWSLVFGLAEARQAGLVRLWGLDPKRLELAYGMEWWDEYAYTAEGMAELLEKAVADMLERNNDLQGKARKFTPSPETPLQVIIIDELAFLSGAIDKKLQQRAQTAMRTILWLGRAAGYSLVGASQDPRKEVLGERDFYPTKVALGMEAPMVDLVLGEGAWDAGAKAEQLPMREAGAGCAYIKDELNTKPLLVRAAWCSDEEIRHRLSSSTAQADD